MPLDHDPKRALTTLVDDRIGRIDFRRIRPLGHLRLEEGGGALAGRSAVRGQTQGGRTGQRGTVSQPLQTVTGGIDRRQIDRPDGQQGDGRHDQGEFQRDNTANIAPQRRQGAANVAKTGGETRHAASDAAARRTRCSAWLLRSTKRIW